LGVRSGFKTASNLVTDLPLPGLLRDLVGATVAEWHGLPPGVSYDVAYEGRGIEVGFWAEALTPDPDVDILASYTSLPFAPRAALTARRVGDRGGRALYLGWYPTPDQAAAIVARVADLAGVRRLAQPLPEGVVMTRRGTSIILLNFTEQAQTMEIAGRRAVLASRDVAVVD
jgi:beta-galactosidase